MSGWGAGYVRSIGYVWARGQTCPVILELEFSSASGRICLAKGGKHIRSFWVEKDLETLEIQLSKDLACRLIVVHILVIDGQVLKIKTIFGLKSIRS
jgi:hypothetical protein